MKKKTVALLLACVMALGVAIGGTMAWLTDDTEAVVNTFTVGDINIELTESDTDANGNRAYSFIPGETLKKDPKVTVEANSEDCWLFIKLDVADNGYGDADPILDWEIISDWTYFDTATKQAGTAPATYANGTYYFYRQVNKSETAQEFKVLVDDEVTVSEKVTKDMVLYINGDGTDKNPAHKPVLTFSAAAMQLYEDRGEADSFTVGEAFDKIWPPTTT